MYDPPNITSSSCFLALLPASLLKSWSLYSFLSLSIFSLSSSFSLSLSERSLSSSSFSAMDIPQWPQGNIGGGGGGVSVRPVEIPAKPAAEKKPRPEKEQALNCPRCNSNNTKFCYYNNYSLSQPRYFCKTCRRYWTEGGTLRNVPVGGGSRKNRRPSSSSSASNIPPSLLSGSKKVIPNISIPKISPPSSTSSPNNPRIHQGEDLSLGFNQSIIYNRGSEFLPSPFGNPNCSDLRIMETMNSGGIINSLISMPISDPNPVYSSSLGFPSHDFKTSLSFSLDGIPPHHQNGYGNLEVVHQDQTRTLISPIEEVKTCAVPGSSNDHLSFDLQETKQLGDSSSNNGYWQMAEGSWLRHII